MIVTYICEDHASKPRLDGKNFIADVAKLLNTSTTMIDRYYNRFKSSKQLEETQNEILSTVVESSKSSTIAKSISTAYAALRGNKEMRIPMDPYAAIEETVVNEQDNEKSPHYFKSIRWFPLPEEFLVKQGKCVPLLLLTEYDFEISKIKGTKDEIALLKSKILSAEAELKLSELKVEDLTKKYPYVEM